MPNRWLSPTIWRCPCQSVVIFCFHKFISASLQKNEQSFCCSFLNLNFFLFSDHSPGQAISKIDMLSGKGLPLGINKPHVTGRHVKDAPQRGCTLSRFCRSSSGRLRWCGGVCSLSSSKGVWEGGRRQGLSRLLQNQPRESFRPVDSTVLLWTLWHSPLMFNFRSWAPSEVKPMWQNSHLEMWLG